MPRVLTDRSLTPYGILPQFCPLPANTYAAWETQTASQAVHRPQGALELPVDRDLEDAKVLA
jgi:hypothetical protein